MSSEDGLKNADTHHPGMRIEMDVRLDPTLGCGQAHRWIRRDGLWEGVIGDDIVTLSQTDDGFECTGTSDKKRILAYFRSEDDLGSIYKSISERDPYVASLAARCPGLRILRQDPWECIATYLLATNANVRRIGMMVESVCREFGRDLGGRYSFPTPEEIIRREENIRNCRLGYRDERFVELAQRVHDGEVDPEAIGELGYRECVESLLQIKGVGPKVADCIALFAYGHTEAFPIDARIGRVLKEVYGMGGSYARLSDFGRERFGVYAGYAQELLYHADFI